MRGAPPQVYMSHGAFIPPMVCAGMIPMVQPPPPVNSKSIPPASTASLADTIHQLRDLISKIDLPRTRTAKTATILVEDLRLVHKLSVSACMLLQEWHEGPQLSDIS